MKGIFINTLPREDQLESKHKSEISWQLDIVFLMFTNVIDILWLARPGIHRLSGWCIRLRACIRNWLIKIIYLNKWVPMCVKRALDYSSMNGWSPWYFFIYKKYFISWVITWIVSNLLFTHVYVHYKETVPCMVFLLSQLFKANEWCLVLRRGNF